MVNDPLVVTVSQLNRRIAFLIKGDKCLADLSVRGEISDLGIKGGHMYFSLNERTVSGETVSVKAVMFSSNVKNLRFAPENGMSVIVTGNVQCYERYGIYQIYVNDIVPAGAGAQAVALRQLRERLQSEGIFSRKRKLPEYPRKVCVITSETGAVLHDICENINPLVKLVLIPAVVQGEKAPESICRAFALANETDADLIIFGRGGGSADDLSAFNDERVVRAVYSSRIPTVSAVGHETDRSLTDYAADASASTPTAAAKLAAPDKGAVMKLIEDRYMLTSDRLKALIKEHEQAVGQIFVNIRSKSPRQRIAANEQLFEMNYSALTLKVKQLAARREEQLDKERADIKACVKRLISDKETEFLHCAELLSEKDPLKILTKGYSVVYKEEKAVTHISQLSSGDSVNIRVNGGMAEAVIAGIVQEEENGR